MPNPETQALKQRTPANVDELRGQLLEAFAMIRDDPRRLNQVKEMVNAAGKVLGTVKAQMEYALLRGEEPDIPFLGKTSGRPLKPAARLLTPAK